MNTLGTLVRQRLRRDRWQLVLWIAGTGLLGLFSATAIAQSFGDAAGRANILALAVSTPAILMVRGLPQGAGLGPFTFFEIYTFLALLAGLMSTFLAVRHTRAEEESGRAELLAATPAARNLATAATVVHGVLANLGMAVAVALGFLAGRLDVGGSVCAGVAVGAAGLSFFGVGLLAAEFMRTSRGANGVAAGAVVLGYFLRGIGDASSSAGADALHRVAGWPSWISPIGWGQQVAAFGANDYLPLLLNAVFAAACVLAVFVLQSRRDTGASLLTGRAGRPAARGWLNGTPALAWRLQWPSILGWCVGGAATGLLAGSLSSLVAQINSSDEAVLNTLAKMVPGTTQTPTQLLLAVMFSIVGVMAAACAVQAVIRLRQEESGGTAELLLAAPVSRVRWLADYLFLGVVAVVLVLLSAAVFAMVSAVGAGEPAGPAGDAFAAAAAQLPAGLVYLGVVALLFVLLPGGATAAGWSVLGLGVVLGIFGSMVGLPDWAQKLSPFQHTPVPFGAGADWSGGIWMLVIAVAAAAVAVRLMRRRELHTT
ncbi:ABC transporter permease [Specibacter sp. RAF43]|uniref:ABC transporter permease n=1 Tax=Specibacter sp. RAF43 TaxID=3233057 RepID=UPI003F95339C